MECRIKVGQTTTKLSATGGKAAREIIEKKLGQGGVVEIETRGKGGKVGGGVDVAYDEDHKPADHIATEAKPPLSTLLPSEGTSQGMHVWLISVICVTRGGNCETGAKTGTIASWQKTQSCTTEIRCGKAGDGEENRPTVGQHSSETQRSVWIWKVLTEDARARLPRFRCCIPTYHMFHTRPISTSSLKGVLVLVNRLCQLPHLQNVILSRRGGCHPVIDI